MKMERLFYHRNFAVLFHMIFIILLLVTSIQGAPRFPDKVETPSGEQYALLIGISNYDYPGVRSGIVPLEFAHEDAKALKNRLEKDFHAISLLNEDAKREDILNQLSYLQETIKPQDSFLLFFAGHGLRNPSNQETYWLTYDTKLDNLEINGIRLSHLMDYVVDIKAKNKLVLLDHCFSGDLVQPKLDLQFSKGKTRGGSIPKVAPTIKKVPEITSMDEFKNSFRPDQEGLLVLAAAHEESYEYKQYGHGLFTAALLETLNSPKADIIKDGSLSLHELTSYLPRRFREMADSQGNLQSMIEGPKEKNSSEWAQNWTLVSLPPNTSNGEKIADQYKAILAKWWRMGWIQVETKAWGKETIKEWLISINGNGELTKLYKKLWRILKNNIDFVLQQKGQEELGLSEQSIAKQIEEEFNEELKEELETQ